MENLKELTNEELMDTNGGCFWWWWGYQPQPYQPPAPDPEPAQDPAPKEDPGGYYDFEVGWISW